MVEEGRAEEKREMKTQMSRNYGGIRFRWEHQKHPAKERRNLSSSSYSLILANVSHWTARGLARGQWNPGDTAWEYQVI